MHPNQPRPYPQPFPQWPPAPHVAPRNGMGTAGLVLGIIALIFSIIPIIGIVAWFIWPP
jgi:hypothetical protein